MLKEIDMGLVTTRGIVRDGQLTEVIRQPIEAPPVMPVCPIRRGSCAVRCRTSCALYQNGACVLSIEGTGEPLGRNCPLVNGPCSEACALYNGGCALITIMGRKD